MTPEVIELEHRDHERAVGHIVLDHPLPFSLLASSHIGFLAAAGRAVLDLYRALSPRVCECPPAERVLEPDGECYRCAGRVVRSAPFRAES